VDDTGDTRVFGRRYLECRYSYYQQQTVSPPQELAV
jgi:hypothetical protein